MSLKDLKFTTADFYDKGVSSLPDRPSEAGITAAELKARFDQIPKVMLALGGFNDMVDELTGENGADNIGAKSGSFEGETVADQLENAAEKLNKKLEGVTVNGKDAPVENGKAKITTPTKVSELDNDRGYINAEEGAELSKDAVNYTLQTRSAAEQKQARENIGAASRAELLQDMEAFAEDILAGDKNTFESAKKYTDSAVADLQPKEAGKGLSEANFTADEKTKLSGIEAGAQKNPAALPNPAALNFTGAATGSYDGSKAVTIEIPKGGANAEAVTYTEQDLTEAQQAQARENIGALGVNDVPKVPENVLTYDAQSLTETQKTQARTNIGAASRGDLLAEAEGLAADIVAGDAATLSSAKLYADEKSAAALNAAQTHAAATFQPKESGKGLSQENYTTTEKNKLAGIEAGAQKNPTDVVKYTAQTLTAAQKEQAKENIGVYTVSVKDYGAKGDGSTDDTTAFQNALAVGGVIEVPDGTYVLSGNITVKDGSELRLSHGTVLKTSGQVILGRWAKISGGIIRVPYNFTSSAILIDQNSNGTDYSAFATTPVLRHGRTISDLTILKSASASSNHTLPETTANIAGNGVEVKSSFPLWNVEIDVNVAGGFDKGIYVHADSSWHHDLRLSCVIEACRIGVYLDNVNNAFIDAIIQPKAAANEAKYAENAIYLKDSKNCTMLKTRLWDWNSNETLYAFGNQYQHIAMIGNCSGAILNDLAYYSSSIDVRDRIYTDTENNLNTLKVLQEPITKWFKPIDKNPYFYNGFENKKLMLREELDDFMQVSTYENFTDVLATATDGSGNIYGGKGYKENVRIVDDGSTEKPTNNYVSTGYVPVKQGQTIYAEGATFDIGDGVCYVFLYKSNFEKISQIGRDNIIGSSDGESNYYVVYTSTDKGFTLHIKHTSAVAYARFVFRKEAVGANIVMAVDEEISYSQVGTLADGIKVKAENIIGNLPGGGGSGADILNADGVIKQEHLPEGYPYKTVEEGYILPESEAVAIGEGQFVVNGELINVISGEEYIVRWNGTDYKCVAQEADAAGTSVTTPCLGNVGAITGENPTTEPFMLMVITPELSGTLPFAVGIFAFDDSAAVTVSIKGAKANYVKMDNSYLDFDWIPNYASVPIHNNSIRFSKNETSVEITNREILKKLYHCDHIIAGDSDDNKPYLCKRQSVFSGDNEYVAFGNTSLLSGVAPAINTGEPFVISIDFLDGVLQGMALVTEGFTQDSSSFVVFDAYEPSNRLPFVMLPKSNGLLLFSGDDLGAIHYANGTLRFYDSISGKTYGINMTEIT